MTVLRRWLALSVSAATCATLCSATAASAHTYAPPPGKVYLGLTAGSSIQPYTELVGFHPPVFERFITWDSNTSWMASRSSALRVRRAVSLTTAYGKYGRGVVSPEGIAEGRSDEWLVTMNRNIAHSGQIVYIRIMSEMNGWWNPYSPYNHNGSKRGKAEWPRFFIAAWRRTVLILRGGHVSAIDSKLHRLGMRPIRGISRRAVLPRPKVAFMWVPMTRGSPEIRQLDPVNFWPGSAYVDWVGTDEFSPWVRFNWLDYFYKRFSAGKPFELAEWGVEGRDDPDFVRAMFSWLSRHPRARMLNYYQGYDTSSPYSPVHFPKSMNMLRRLLSSPEFPQYTPEYMPKCGQRLRLERLCAPGA